MDQTLHYDVAIAGAGPAGLSLARSLDGSGLRVVLIDGQTEQDLATPAFDGREIALTHHSMAVLKRLGVWNAIDPSNISPLREARVMNAGRAQSLHFGPGSDHDRLGVLIPNHALRKALFETVKGQARVEIIAGRRILKARARSGDPSAQSTRNARLELDNGDVIHARLLVAADSRFSSVRTQLGVGADINHLGRSMTVCRFRHERPHGHTAVECFDYGQTLALLPLNGEGGDQRTSSVVLTLPTGQADDLAALPDIDFEAMIRQRLNGRLGAAHLAGTRHVYPLAVTWSHRFAGDGFALIGDAAVGMHPVTAHGFNLGLKGQERLAAVLRKAAADGRDIASASTLAAYDAGHRRDALPLYLGTNAVSRLFTDERPTARIARHISLQIAQRLTPFKYGVRRLLTDPG